MSEITQAGTVACFDAERGLGTLASATGEYFFHCTAIADGTRMIAVGTPVRFVVAPGHGGRYEARRITPAHT